MSSSIFTRHERKGTSWGVQRMRMGADSVQQFDACALCMASAAASEPVCCSKGHLYCKGCVYESLLTQKQLFKAQAARYEEQQQRDADEAARASESAAARAAAFAQQESSLLPSSEIAQMVASAKQIESAAEVPEGYERVDTPDGVIFKRSRSEAANKQATTLTCYWLPSLAPEATARVEKPKKHTNCPAGGHTLRMKQLKPVLFTRDKDGGGYQCPTCRTALSNATKAFVLRTCGHLLCQACADLAREDKCCAACSESCREDDVVELQTGGTGYAARGGTVIESEVTPTLM